MARLMLFDTGMKKLDTVAALLFLLVTSVAACKSKDQKSAEAVANARDQFADKQDQVVDKQGEADRAKVAVDQAKTDVIQARANFVKAVDARLLELDVRITKSRVNAEIDQGKVATLRAEAVALRGQAADEARPFVEDARNTFERIVKDLEFELSRR